MTHQIIQTIIKQSPHLKWMEPGTILLVRGGSHSHGTNTIHSDIDYRGVCIPSKEYFFGFLHRFEQAELKDPNPDTVMFDIRKFIHLASVMNPNVIEILFTDPSDHLFITPLGQKLFDHRELFVSKRCKHTFMGYATSQLRRIELHRRYLLHPLTHCPTRTELGLPEYTLIPQDQLTAAFAAVQKELDHLNFDFMNNLDEPTRIEVVNAMKDILVEMKVYSDEQFVAMGRKIGLSENFIEVLKRERKYNVAKKEWDHYQNWKKTRNATRAELEAKYGYDTKHACHLIRLSRMAKEILTTGKVIVKRPDREELLAIRNGAWTYEQILEFANNAEKELNEIYNSVNILPNMPNQNKLDQLCVELVETYLDKGNV